MNGRFYTLRWKGGDFRSDEHLAASENTVRIGQKGDCDVAIPNTGPYADELFAVIKPAKSADGWQIIPVSDFVQTIVNGSPVGLNHYLKSGDHITFSETNAEIEFEVRKGENSGISHFTSVSRRFVSVIANAAVVVVALALYGIFAPVIEKNRNNARNISAIRDAEQSIVQLTVDSIFFVKSTPGKDDTLRRESSYGEQDLVMNGTAFLTNSGILVTARHCVEPWLNFNFVFNSGIDYANLPVGTAWALEAETYNQTHHNDTSYCVISKCTLRGSNGYLGTFRSSEFKIDRTRDEIVELGDFEHEYYLRSITGRFNRSDMMLGDIAALPLPSHTGSIEIPTDSILEQLVTTESILTFKGYPKRQEPGIETLHGGVLKDYAPGHMISHNGGLEPGYSGGPALVVRDGKAYAVGVISTYDKDSDHCIYSVPVSELKNILAQ